MNILTPVLDQIAKLWEKVDVMPTIRWGTVASASPLTVFLDGAIDTAGNPVAAPARSAVGDLTAGARVLCLDQHRRVTVQAAPSPRIPDAQYALGALASYTLTSGASSWRSFETDGMRIDLTPERDLVVDVIVSAIVSASTGYTRIGVNISGGLALLPTQSPGSPTDDGRAEWTPFSSVTVDNQLIAIPKRVVIPAGVQTSFAFWGMRNVGSGTHVIKYLAMTVTPVRWA